MRWWYDKKLNKVEHKPPSQESKTLSDQKMIRWHFHLPSGSPTCAYAFISHEQRNDQIKVGLVTHGRSSAARSNEFRHMNKHGETHVVLVQIPIQAKYYYKRRRYLHSDDTGIYCKLNHSQLKAPPVDGSPERCRITSGQEGISEAGHLPQGRIGAAGPAAGHLDVLFLCKIL